MESRGRVNPDPWSEAAEVGVDKAVVVDHNVKNNIFPDKSKSDCE